MESLPEVSNKMLRAALDGKSFEDVGVEDTPYNRRLWASRIEYVAEARRLGLEIEFARE